MTATIREFSRHYVLDAERNVVPADVLTWAAFFENDDNRQVAIDYPNNVCVSTVFNGLPLASELLTQPAHPLLFETRVFGGLLDGEVRRYASWNEAVAGHAAILARVHTASGAS